MYLFIIVIIIIYLFVNVNYNFAHEALRTRFNVSMRSRFTFYLEFGNVFFFKGKRIPGDQEKTSRIKAEKTRITYRVHSGTSNTLKEASAQTTGLTPGGRGNSKKFGIVVGLKILKS